MEGGDLAKTLHLNGAFMTPRLITHHIIQKGKAISSSRLGYLFNKQLFTSFVGCRKIIWSRTRDHSRYIMASKLNGMRFSPCVCTAYEFH
jgi:hypothetical protein